ncbi:hypothetical protein Nepgr_013698 [Nepenthes gracilis]|uniref:Uncharacterized protein n=1 Tax=Nepenthes gracilis TaxID=150966 RepID=A0AAD3SIU4_NEPGR|nr:hypothetical protein Nepgr_013698 [Nepenthes gracilis]
MLLITRVQNLSCTASHMVSKFCSNSSKKRSILEDDASPTYKHSHLKSLGRKLSQNSSKGSNLRIPPLGVQPLLFFLEYALALRSSCTSGEMPA